MADIAASVNNIPTPPLGSPTNDIESSKKEKYDLEGLSTKETTPTEVLDGGRTWWTILGCFIVSALIMGWPLVWGVFQSFYSTHVFPDTGDTILSLLGTTQSTVMSITCFFSGKLADRYGHKRFIAIGSFLACLSFLTAAFSTKLWHFFITQGLLPGLSNGFVWPIIVSIPSMWFKRKRAFATGIVVGGASFGGGAGSLIVRALLSAVGLRTTLLIYLAINISLLGTAYMLIRVRQMSADAKQIQWIDRSLFKDGVFWSLTMCLFFVTFGYQTPMIFLSTYTMEKVPMISPQLSVAPLSVLNFSSALGRVVVGFVADKAGYTNAFMASVFMNTAAQLLIWNLAESYATILIFAVIVGSIGGCFLSLLAPVGAQLFGPEKLAALSGLLILFNLPGNLAGSPIAGAILSASNRNWHAAICYNGAIQALGVLSFLYARFKKQPKLFAVY
ncbi:hypothetical protein FRC02_007521 [Tulasnella sp. 418]|nr:hypothetical protein FRC02_007521 [Tulasnella sp. 418]